MESGRVAKVDIFNGVAAQVQIKGMSTWNHSGGGRRVIEAPETFDAEFVEKLPGILEGGEIEIAGALKPDDPGQVLARAAFVAGTQYTEGQFRLFVNGLQYYTPDSATIPASKVWFSKKPDAVGADASAVAAVSMTLVVNGQLKLV